MCLSDPDTAILIGGETADQQYCKDSLWKLELGWLKYLVYIKFIDRYPPPGPSACWQQLKSQSLKSCKAA